MSKQTDAEREARKLCNWEGCNQVTNKDMCGQCIKVTKAIQQAEQRGLIESDIKWEIAWNTHCKRHLKSEQDREKKGLLLAIDKVDDFSSADGLGDENYLRCSLIHRIKEAIRKEIKDE